ncbi:hypothetical protein BHE74_00035284 [Ensete ventricosum]|nr:hypothetical protein BHE74_00035284 [Ensete ventricosum]
MRGNFSGTKDDLFVLDLHKNLVTSLTGRQSFEEGCAVRVGYKSPLIVRARGAGALVPDRRRCVGFCFFEAREARRREEIEGKASGVPPLASSVGFLLLRGEEAWTALVVFRCQHLCSAVLEKRMESTYRMWTRNRRNGFGLEASDEWSRELRTALGTAKWQLEEFEKAVRATHGNYSSEENNTIDRHRQFVAAIRNQILLVEKELNHSLFVEGKQPLRWVQLNDDERDDLAVFLSGVQHKFQQPKDKNADLSKAELVRSFMDGVRINKGKGCVEEFTAKEPYKSKVDEVHAKVVQLNGQTEVLSSPDIGAWKIVIADEDTNKGSTEVRAETLNHGSSQSGILGSVESTSKLKLFKNNPWKAKHEELLPLRNGLSYYLDSKRVRRFAQVVSIFHPYALNGAYI